MTDALSSSGPFLFVVVGATGHTGCACVDELLRLGHRVRGVVRSQQSAERLAAKGVEPCIVDVTDTQALTEAFCGADGAYLLHPANRSQHDDDDWVATAEAVSRSLVTAAVRSKLPAVVALSSTGAQHSCGTGNVVHAHVFERLLEGSPLNYTVVRAPAFMDNWGREVDDVVEKGVLISLYWDSHRPFSQVAASDVGLCAARELLRRLLPGPEVTRRYVHEIRGPNDYSVDDVAAVFGNLLARPVHVVAIEPSDQAAWLRAKGVSATTASQVTERYAAQAKGMLDVVGDEPTTRGTVTLVECLGGFLSQRDA